MPPVKQHIDPSNHPTESAEAARKQRSGCAAISRGTLCALRDGDPEAFRTVYMKYHTPLVKFLTALIRSRDEAEELAQDVMAEIWEKRAVIRPDGNIGSLIYTMSRNAAYSLFRHRRVSEKYADAAGRTCIEDISGEDVVIADETRLLAEIVLSRMPEKRRRIYEMSRSRGMTYEEISREMKISRKAVEYHMSQALSDLREVLALFTILLTLPSQQ